MVVQIPLGYKTSLEDIAAVISSILEARNLIIICGAGVSVSAGIPDFRSSQGLFTTGALSKDLLDANVWNTTTKALSLCKILAIMHQECSQASPTPFHLALKMLDEKGGLLHVYTQNIDFLESKAGLSFGIPQMHSPQDMPRCIPLHGTLETLACIKCCYQSPLHLHVSTLVTGCLPLCPACEQIEHERRICHKRPRTSGTLTPTIVLYGQTHPAADHLAQAIMRDANGNSKKVKPDVLLVASTSLKIPGIIAAVHKFSQAVHSQEFRGGYRSIYLDQKPLSSKWDGIFDTWVSGDLQIFAQHLIRSLSHQFDQSIDDAICSKDSTTISILVQDLSSKASFSLKGKKHIFLNVDHPFYIPEI
ncbi:DHS-like NAD/FAD-binding domain-containing protein [Suillus plorans]|uniref:DHS-like NAD/FAD-binding domain-containing protein n=1 Tax=Suillus plorans TaxID=116603 RepID=A0A9P7AAP4_9AGAM|nr:DHS-like NAD/FAD-binding domain-containing protein [Suillus plorans]KAG1785188.1 DHS-like NAD/FAD-binding domain-containing protein [Suillus plorans]